LSRRLIASRFWRFGQFRFAAELDAARLGAFAAFTGAGADELAPFSATQLRVGNGSIPTTVLMVSRSSPGTFRRADRYSLAPTGRFAAAEGKRTPTEGFVSAMASHDARSQQPIISP